MQGAYERILVKPCAVADPSVLEMPIPWDDHQEQQQQWKGVDHSAVDGRTGCVDLKQWNKKL